MAPREKLALAGTIVGVIATIVWALITWGGLDVRGTDYEWLGFLVGFGLAGIGLVLGIASASAKPEDDREVMIGLKAERVTFRAGIAGLVIFYISAGGVFAPIPGGAMMCLMFALFTTATAARLYYYRHGV